ncbi:unnamed protein product [Adineta steineri]|uniref:Uncharacterized protein n=1 Tax=Adineta steineri TaxID=433720 RepID=A0A813XSG7_9BILA|nr:unnamed protein product [Adineta steineri]CAF4142495.1 unnamed protein product [Adineta steineri]
MAIGNPNTEVDATISGSGSNNQISVSDLPSKLKNGTAVQDVMNTVGKTAGKIIESGGDIITAPAVWLKDIQQNWLTYMIVTAIILPILAFFYCSFTFYLNKKRNNMSNNNLLNFAKTISNKNGTMQNQLPLSLINLPSVSSNTPAQLMA